MKIILLSFLCLLCANSYAQSKAGHSDHGLHIPYDTISLKKGYFLVFEKTESHRYLRLKGPTVDTLIRQINIKASESNLGRIGMDEDEYFMLYVETSCYGINLFQKATGNLMANGCLIGKDTIHNIFYFVDWKDDLKLGIFNMKTMKVELFPSPKTACNFWWECLESKSITDSLLTIEYFIPPNKKVKKTYERQQD